LIFASPKKKGRHSRPVL